MGKFNPYHDEIGRFTSGDGADGAGAGTQVAWNDVGPTMTDAGGGHSPYDEGAQRVAQDLTQTCGAYIALNRQGKVLRVFPGQFLTSTLQEVIAAAKAGDPAAKKACKLLFDNRFGK